MGQSSSPIISKLGLTMYWNNMWDDKLNFSKKLKEDILINMFLFLIFTGCVYYTNIFYSTTNFYFTQSFFLKNKISSKNYFNDFIVINHKDIISFLKPSKIKYRMHYIGKIWILRFQGWLVIMFHLYIPQVKKNLKKVGDEIFFLKKINKPYNFHFFKKTKYLPKFLNFKSFNTTLFYNWYFYNLISNKLNLSNNSHLNTFNLLY